MAKVLERDWAFVREADAVLEDYLLSPELFWQMSGMLPGSSGMGMLQLTLGNLCLSLERLSAVEWLPKEQTELAAMRAHIEAVRNRWRANWAKKAAQEYQARLRQWAAYLQEVPERSSIAGYAYQVRLRVILELLNREIVREADDVPTSHLFRLDQRLRTLTAPAEFVWETEVQPAFPADAFWFLYVSFKTIR